MAARSVACCLNEAMTLYRSPLASVSDVKGSTLMSATMCDMLRDPEPSQMSRVTSPAHKFPCAFWGLTASNAGTLNPDRRSSEGSDVTGSVFYGCMFCYFVYFDDDLMFVILHVVFTVLICM